jgi:hypothetical protein
LAQSNPASREMGFRRACLISQRRKPTSSEAVLSRGDR